MVDTSEGVTASAFVRRTDERTVLATRSVVVTADADGGARATRGRVKAESQQSGAPNGALSGASRGAVGNGANPTARDAGAQISLSAGARRALEASAQTGARGAQPFTRADLDLASTQGQSGSAGRSDPTARISEFATDLAEIFGANDANAAALAARIGGRSAEINARFGDLARQAEATGFTFNELTFSVRVDAATVTLQESANATTIRLEQLSLSLEVSRGGNSVDPSRAAIAQDPFDLDPGSFRFVPPPEQTASEVAEELRRVFGESNVGVNTTETRAEILIGETVFTASAASPDQSGSQTIPGAPVQQEAPRQAARSNDNPIAKARRVDLEA